MALANTYGAHRYAYQILTAIEYALEKEMEQLSIEGPNYEDSLFLKDEEVTIGEAKYVKSKKHWTIKSLYYEGDRMGPLLQLWNRWSGREKLVLFSPIPVKKSKGLMGNPRIPVDLRSEMLSQIEEEFSSLRDIESFKKQGIDNIMEKTWFETVSLDHLQQQIIDWADIYDVTSNEARVSELLSYFSSPNYPAGKWISFESLLTKLASDREKPILHDEQISFKTVLENRMADRVYFALIWPKSIEECAAFAYGSKGPAQSDAIESTIDVLCRNNFVQKVHRNDSTLYKSTYVPLFNYCRQNILKRSKDSKKINYPALTRHDEQIFENIFNSRWLSDLLETNMPRKRITVDMNGGTYIYECIKELADFLEVLCQISECFSIRHTGNLMPCTEDYDTSVDFDEFGKEWIYRELDEDWVDPYIEDVFSGAGEYLGYDRYPRERLFLDSLKSNKQFLCIPKEFASKMTRCHRIQLTIAQAFCRD